MRIIKYKIKSNNSFNVSLIRIQIPKINSFNDININTIIKVIENNEELDMYVLDKQKYNNNLLLALHNDISKRFWVNIDNLQIYNTEFIEKEYDTTQYITYDRINIGDLVNLCYDSKFYINRPIHSKHNNSYNNEEYVIIIDDEKQMQLKFKDCKIWSNKDN